MISTNENITAGSTTLQHIESLTAEFSALHGDLAAIVQQMVTEIEQLQKSYHIRLKSAVNKASAAKLSLHTAIEGSPHLFKKPKTYVFHGVKVGFQKQKGSVKFEDEEKTVALIHKIFGEDAPAYLRTTEVPDKKMLQDMAVGDLKKIGCTVTQTCDKVVINPTDSEVEKTVATLLRTAVESEAAS